MGQPIGDNGTPDARAFMDKAIESGEKGYQVTFATENKAKHFRQRCYTARERERARNLKIYTVDDLQYGTSIWQSLTFAIVPVGEMLLCSSCQETVGQHHQLVATSGANSLDAKSISHGVYDDSEKPESSTPSGSIPQSPY